MRSNPNIVTYELTHRRDIPVEQLDLLFRAIGWRRDATKWQKVLDKSDLLCSAWDRERLIGFGRTLEDGVMCMIYDVGVHPGYQRQGIGKNIMTSIITHVKDRGYASIGLFAWEENSANIPFLSLIHI